MTISYSGNFFQLLLRWKGSIWRSVWKELIVYLAMFYAIRLFYTDVIPLLEEWDDDDDDKHKYKRMFERICDMFDNYTKQIPLTFLLGFYVSNVVSRWWRQFECLNWPEDILSMLCTVIPGDSEQSQRRRHNVARYLNLANALAWRDISSKIRLRFPTVRHLIDAGLLTQKEFQTLEDAHTDCETIRWMTPLHWVQHIIAEEVKENAPMASLVNNFMSELKTYRQQIRRLYCYDWVCVPLVYTQVAALATYAYFFFSLFGRQFIDSRGDKQVDLILPIFTIVQYMFFVGWFKVGQDLMRPFGLDDDDIELNYILDRNIATSFSIVHKLQPAPVPEPEDDQFWLERAGRLPQLPHTPFSRGIGEHKPKLHSYIKVKGDMVEAEEEAGTSLCGKTWKTKRHITW